MRRVPVCIRLDMRSGHTFTRGFKKPFDDVLVKTMQETMKYLCENIQGCVLGYTQSDEISLVLVDYADLNTDAWFGNNLQKMCSVSASMATMAFNKFFSHNVEDLESDLAQEHETDGMTELVKNMLSYYRIYRIALKKGAMFDSRVFTIPREEVCNYLLWRQQDATRNSIQSVGQANFSQKQLHGKSCNDIQDMLMLQKGINWNDYPTTLKRGSCCIKTVIQDPDVDIKDGAYPVTRWAIDNEIPIFSQDRNYVEKLI